MSNCCDDLTVDKLTAELLATRDALHRACYALLSLEYTVERRSHPATKLGADAEAAGFLAEAKSAPAEGQGYELTREEAAAKLALTTEALYLACYAITESTWGVKGLAEQFMEVAQDVNNCAAAMDAALIAPAPPQSSDVAPHGHSAPFYDI